MEGFRVACEHNRLRCTNGEFFCLDCGQQVEPPRAAEVEDEKVTSASGRKIGFEAENPRRRAKKGATKE